jgi:iron complex transport system permease protein
MADVTLSLPGDRETGARRTLWALIALLLAVSVLSLAQGAAGTSLWSVLGAALRGEEVALRDRVVLLDIRLPRLALGCLVGASLAVSGQ